MASLYDLTGEWLEAQQFVEECESDDERANALEYLLQTESSIEEKFGNITRMVRNLTAEGEALKAEEKRLEKRRKGCEASVERLKGYLYDSMKALSLKKFKTGIGTWSIQVNPISVTILDADKVPAKYHIPQPDKIDRAAIKKDHDETGEIIDGTDISQGESLRFR